MSPFQRVVLVVAVVNAGAAVVFFARAVLKARQAGRAAERFSRRVLPPGDVTDDTMAD